MKWEVVIGLETHAQLSTQSKIFSGASIAFGAAPNTQACAVDIALPGVLPVLNKGAVERAIRFGLAVGSNIARRSVFARKNYFYPDLPKGYQISQFELPVVVGGTIKINVDGEEKIVRLTRAHLEEDAGKSLHEDFHGLSGIDLNRAGTPLLEIVTEPDMRSSKEAVAYAKALHTLVRWIGICDGNMQEGSFRCDANVSVRPVGAEKLGTRREIKNLNSFRFLQQAIDYEVRWQIETLEDGGRIEQATVLFDPDTGETRAMRSKEDAQDYRYFPDPDLLPLEVSENWINRVRGEMPELPQAMAERFTRDYGLTAYDAGVLTSSQEMASYFEETVAAAGGREPKLCANWIMGDLTAQLNRGELEIGQSPISSKALAGLLQRIFDNTISGKIAKEVFEAMWAGEGSADEVIEKRGLKQISDVGAIEKIIDEIIAANPAQLAEYRAGKEKAFNFFVGQAMKASKGKANPAQVNDILRRKLGSL
ncbi:MAG TPA: Asp-tRNA(Asn)/Glu-tRNA(Gln) amidotransferase subunit GatB [Burkholderiales bacterium]|nr:Asp-tRNA(Asn)/Glu-tRNA(Gln) amidotransferase subunit GatB [Burkholderiales bacterium]